MPVAVGGQGRLSSPKGGRPRDPRVDEAVLAAALDALCEQGYGRFTVEGVALRAGVAKTTVYRRWSTKEALILDAIAKIGLAERPEVPDTGSLYQDMLSYLCAWIRFRRAESWVGEILASAELKDLFRKKLGGRLTSGFRTIIERAVERGDLSPRADVDLIVTLPMALMHQQWALTGRPADEALVRRIADQFFSQSDPPSRSRRRRS